MSSLLKKKGAASFKPRAPVRRLGPVAPPSASPPIPSAEKQPTERQTSERQAQTPAPSSTQDIPRPSVEVEHAAASEVQSASVSAQPARPTSPARQHPAVIPTPPSEASSHLQPATVPLDEAAIVPVLPSIQQKPSETPTLPPPQGSTSIPEPTSLPPSVPIPAATTAELPVVAASNKEVGIGKPIENSAKVFAQKSSSQNIIATRDTVSQPSQAHVESGGFESNDAVAVQIQDESVDLSSMGAGETGHPSQLIPVVPLNADGTSGTPIPVQPAKPRPKARKRKLDDANIDIRPTIEVQVLPTKVARTGTAPKKPRQPRTKKPKDTTPAVPKVRKKRAETPEDAENQEIDHSTIKMAELCKDLKIGRKFSKHDEIKQREIEKKAKAKLRRENPELAGDSDEEVPTRTTRSATETPVQTTSVGPRMRLVDGQIVIDESSLNLDRHKLGAANAGVMEIVEENEFTRITTSGTFMKREKNIFWDVEAEEKFYTGLRMFGTDFEMISKMFPDRNRRQIKLKFNKEERLYPSKINSALLGERVPIDFDEYKSHTGLEYEDVAVINAEREEIEAEQNAEEARVESELAEATRQKKAAIHGGRIPDGKENDALGGASHSTKAKKKGKKNKASVFGGGEDVEILGEI